MRTWTALKTFMAALLTGMILPACVIDMRDAAISGLMDAVTGSVSDSVRLAVPVADWVAKLLGYPVV